ncbi:pyridoxamine 5'-phosphate oxidase family protein [bacterium]|nr:pyridoxamine 5'-phosphate oxidase family protein [bacterium]
MKPFKQTIFLLLSLAWIWVFCGKTTPRAEEVNVQAAKEAKAIEVEASLTDDHPAIEEGITCADCHEIKLDAKTTATQIWLTGEYLGFAKNEGAMTNEKVREEIIKAMGGKKKTGTCVLGTCINNTPMTTTAEFTLNPDTMTLHGMHEKGTAKLLHIKQNPRVSLNWHKEFIDWSDALCIQFIGHAELIEGTNPEFEKIMIDCLPYEKNATQRKITLDQARNMAKQMMIITKITVDEATITNMQFRKEGCRPWQRWMRKTGQQNQ